MDIAAWLRELGVERYEQAFGENDIDAEILPKLTADDLNSIGVGFGRASAQAARGYRSTEGCLSRRRRTR